MTETFPSSSAKTITGWLLLRPFLELVLSKKNTREYSQLSNFKIISNNSHSQTN